uniref:Rhomboid domain containing 1 n=1 Tax=Nothoprocta perdicaria TaxID=30464 RepID=A0A8C6ZV06_NOTPE
MPGLSPTQEVSGIQQNLRTSFAGHLAGILVGLMYTVGPLKRIMKACAGIMSLGYFVNSSLFISILEYYDRPGYEYSTRRNYDVYTGGLTEEEQLERAVLNSLNERGRNHMAFYIFYYGFGRVTLLQNRQFCLTAVGIIRRSCVWAT